ncbi:hypothetical protein HDK64DRAFT_27320 [Phyllosticta capitalensis]
MHWKVAHNGLVCYGFPLYNSGIFALLKFCSSPTNFLTMAHQNSRAMLKQTEQEARDLEDLFETIDELEVEQIRRQEICDPFEDISDTEAQEIKAEEHSDLYYKKITDDSMTSFGMDILRASAATAGSLVKSLGKKAKKALLPKQDPSPEELHCPCWSYPEDGWKFCFVKSHVKAAIKRIEKSQKKK